MDEQDGEDKIKVISRFNILFILSIPLNKRLYLC